MRDPSTIPGLWLVAAVVILLWSVVPSVGHSNDYRFGSVHKNRAESFIGTFVSAPLMTLGKASQCGRAVGSMVLWILIAGSAPGTEIPEVVRQAKPAIVQIFGVSRQGTLRTGTGFFVTATGVVVTNFHVIALPIEGISDSQHVYAKTASGDLIRLKHVIYWSFNPDLAVLAFDTNETPFLDVAHSSAAQEGQRVLVIGNPEGLYGTVSDGIISAFRDDGAIIQITAPISPGSSGSPVLNENGKVIGVATSIWKEGQNLNFAVSSDALMALENRQHESWQRSKSLVAPANSNDLRNAKTQINSAYQDLFGLLDTKEKELFICDQSLWTDMRLLLSKPNSTGFCDLTLRRVAELRELCLKYGPVSSQQAPPSTQPVPTAPDHQRPTPTPDYGYTKWPDERLLTHPEHFVKAHVINLQPDDRLELRSGPGTTFDSVTEIPPNATDIILFDQDWVRNGDTIWCPVDWHGYLGYLARKYLSTR
jgi:V8-like Glu-specific endopeptidase